jgi:branched-chain amino acid transport system substrate-binding protein
VHIHRIAVALAAALIIAAAAGCGSGSDEGSSGSSGPASKLAGKPIVIGSVGSFTGPQAPALGAVDETLQAWAKFKNANGGINGHPVKLLTADDTTNPAKASQLVRKMVEQEASSLSSAP